MAHTPYAPPPRRVSFALDDEELYPPPSTYNSSSTIDGYDRPRPYHRANNQRVADELRGLNAFASIIGDPSYPPSANPFAPTQPFDGQAYDHGYAEGYRSYGPAPVDYGTPRDSTPRGILRPPHNTRPAEHGACDENEGDSRDTLQRYVDARNQAMTPEERVIKLRDELQEAKKQKDAAKVEQILAQVDELYDSRENVDSGSHRPHAEDDEEAYQEYDGASTHSRRSEDSVEEIVRRNRDVLSGRSEDTFSLADSIYTDYDRDAPRGESPPPHLVSDRLLDLLDDEDAYDISHSARDLRAINAAREARRSRHQTRAQPSDLSELSGASTYSNPATSPRDELESDQGGPVREYEGHRAYRHVESRVEVDPPRREDRGGQSYTRNEQPQRYSSNEGRTRESRGQESTRGGQPQSYTRSSDSYYRVTQAPAYNYQERTTPHYTQPQAPAREYQTDNSRYSSQRYDPSAHSRQKENIRGYQPTYADSSTTRTNDRTYNGGPPSRGASRRDDREEPAYEEVRVRRYHYR